MKISLGKLVSKTEPIEVTKPCHVLNYCPYGPLVEDFKFPKEKTTSCTIFGHMCPVYSTAEHVKDDLINSLSIKIWTEVYQGGMRARQIPTFTNEGAIKK